MSQSILIFGAGLNQITLIETAKRLGLRVVVIDPCHNPPGKLLADVFYQVSGTDYERTKCIAEKEEVGGIITSQMENPLRLMARLAQEKGYIFHSPDIVECCRNKFLMKQAFVKNNIPCAKGILINQGDEISRQKLEKCGLNFPLIVKPTDSHSSRGVLKINDESEINRAVNIAASFSSDESVIIEEFLEGPEYSIETISFQGETDLVQFTEKIITPYPYTVELGHIQPACLNEDHKQKLNILVIKAIHALRIDNSAAHLEVKLCGTLFKIIEVGARLGGDFISSHLTYASTGVSMDEAALQVSIGLEPNLDRKFNHYSMIQYIELPVGKIVKEILPIEDLLQIPNVIFAHVFLNKGDVVKTIATSSLRPGCIIVKGETRQQVVDLAKMATHKLLSRIILE